VKSLLLRADILKAKLKVLETGEAQTRRLSGLRKLNEHPDKWDLAGWDGGYKAFVFYERYPLVGKSIVKPKYQVGEVVYLPEAWRIISFSDDLSEALVYFPDSSKGNWCEIPHNLRFYYFNRFVDGKYHEWQSPLFMPEIFARYFAQITAVRYQRLWEISEDDAIKEGITMNNTPWPGWYWMKDTYSTDCPLLAFGMLWNSISPKQKWETNPWVIVYSFTATHYSGVRNVRMPRV